MHWQKLLKANRTIRRPYISFFFTKGIYMNHGLQFTIFLLIHYRAGV